MSLWFALGDRCAYRTLSVHLSCSTTGVYVRFATRYEKGDTSIKSEIIEFAKFKLLGPPDKRGNRESIMAALGVRVLLDFEPRRQPAVDLEAKLVAGNMRVVFSVPSHREYLRSGAPSEPILAEAAAQFMNETRGWGLSELRKVVGEGLIDKGERGELVARCLMLRAFDRAVHKVGGSKNPPFGAQVHPEKLRYSRGIPLVDFLRALVADGHIEMILKSKPDNIPDGETLETAFKDARVYFTHFAKASNGHVVSDVTAWMAMARGIIFQCHKQQKKIDLIAYVLLNGEEKLGRKAMTALFIQIKNSTQKKHISIDADKLGFFSPGTDEENRRPYITLALQLGVQPTPPSNKAMVPRKVPVSPSRVSVGESTRTSPRFADRAVHPRYAISILGCSHTVYGVIGVDERDDFAALLASRSLLAEHPRQDPISLEAVRGLKPFWSEESYGWAEHPEWKAKPRVSKSEGVLTRQWEEAGERAAESSDEESGEEGSWVHD